MSAVRVTLRDGRQLSLDAAEGEVLMEVLRNGGADVDGTCGGACSCGTCHVYVGEDWIARLPARSEDESLMLEAIGEFVPLQPGSRLACQIAMKSEFRGIAVTVAPQVE